MHGDAFRDPAGECVQINVLFKVTSVRHSLIPHQPFQVHCTSNIKGGFILRTLFFFGFPHRVGSWEVVAAHHLHVGLLDEGDPQLVPVAGVRTQQLSVVIHGQEVVNDHLQGSSGHNNGDQLVKAENTSHMGVQHASIIQIIP